MRRLLEVAVRAYRASGGEVHIESQGAAIRSFQTGTVTGEPGLRASASSGALQVEILLSGGDQSREAAALQPALAAVLIDTTTDGQGPS